LRVYKFFYYILIIPLLINWILFLELMLILIEIIVRTNCIISCITGQDIIWLFHLLLFFSFLFQKTFHLSIRNILPIHLHWLNFLCSVWLLIWLQTPVANLLQSKLSMPIHWELLKLELWMIRLNIEWACDDLIELFSIGFWDLQ